jgi:hypothetical protein
MPSRETALVLLAVLAALPLAVAQGTPAGSSTQGAAAGAGTAPSPRASAGDPRVCLEFPTNVQVITCAEKYRPQRRRE